MRWAHEQVDFEPGGKDHSTPGGSFDTGKEIVKLVNECQNEGIQEVSWDAKDNLGRPARIKREGSIKQVKEADLWHKDGLE